MAEAGVGKYCYEYPRPCVTTDAVVLMPREERLSVLLVRRAHPPYKDMWALPGGFIEMDEPLENAAARELREETGVVARALTQIGAFGAPGRDPRGRTICVAFLVTDFSDAAMAGGDDAAEARWWPVDALPPLAFDHADILAAALAARTQ